MAAKKYLALSNGRIAETNATVQSAGAADDGKIVALDPAGKIDQTLLPAGLNSDSVSLPASEALSAGDVVNIWDDVGTARVRKADATAPDKEAVGFVNAAVSGGAAATVFFEGSISGKSGLTPGARQYLSDSTPGAITPTPPTTAGHVVQFIGIAINTTSVSLEVGEPITLA